MKMRASTWLALVLSLHLLLALVSSSILPAMAQEPEPPLSQVEANSTGPFQAGNGLWAMRRNAGPRVSSQTHKLLATGGPDQFGYTWDDTVAFSWIDATGGTDSGLGGATDVVGPVALPFSFTFYGNTYNQIYISKHGYAGFTNSNLSRNQSRLPDPSTPNNVLAPYWAPLLVNESGYLGKVYYTNDGTAPNRYFVVEWHQVRENSPATSDLTFEAILYENGEILFQYGPMMYGGGGPWWCGAGGIEDSLGWDGLSYVSFCAEPPSSKAVRFYRPMPSAHVTVSLRARGRHTYSGENVAFQVPVRNSGELGSDVFDLSAASPWTASLYAADGLTPLIDNDSDGTVDTGTIAPGAVFTITAKVQTPLTASVSDANTASLTVRSSLDTGQFLTVTLQTAVPAAFAQVYRDSVDNAMSIYLAKPNGQTVTKTTGNNRYGSGMAVAETWEGDLAYAWFVSRQYRGIQNVYEIEYTILKPDGSTRRAVTKLTDLSGAAFDTFDYNPAVAASPDGRIGIVWSRRLVDSTGLENYNIYFAILDASGNFVHAPTNLTNSAVWGFPGSASNVPQFFNARVVASGDNRFILAWHNEHWEGSDRVDDIFYAVRDTAGGAVHDVTKLTNDIAGTGDGHHGSNMAALAGDRALLAWFRVGPSAGIYFAVLDSSGNVVKNLTNLGVDVGSIWYGTLDVVQLPNGRIVLGWIKDKQVRYGILEPSSYSTVFWYGQLTNWLAPLGNGYISLAADAQSRAIITWMDYDTAYHRNLYYALVNGNGTVLTSPMIYRTSLGASPYIFTSYEGYGNTSRKEWPAVMLPFVIK